MGGIIAIPASHYRRSKLKSLDFGFESFVSVFQSWENAYDSFLLCPHPFVNEIGEE
jgi:hypothetical protein